MPNNKRWRISPVLPPQANESLTDFPPIFRQILFNRGYASDAEARAFIDAKTIFDTSPWQMTGMKPAVERILRAIKAAEPIAIYGDYDVDGVTATALLVQTIDALKGITRGYIPNRFDEGYGLNCDALDGLKATGFKLVITVDCGVRSPDEAAHAKTIGLDLIITDHHQPAEGDLPRAFAVINPKQEGDQYPDKDLAGVGIAYKVVQALLDKDKKNIDGQWSSTVNNLPSSFLDSLLDLVALGTVADMAPLTGENRSLVRGGLQCFRQTHRQGLYSLANVAGLDLPTTTATNIGFILGPRLNAAGRLDSAQAALDLLTTTNHKIAGELALKLDAQNHERQSLTRQILEQAQELAAQDDLDSLLIFAIHPDFNTGVVGLVAARLVEAYYRPAIVGQTNHEMTRCSCRSIPEFHITQALDQCKDLLVRHGGHAAAAGFTIRNENLDALKKRLKSIAAEQLKGQDLRPTLIVDAEVKLSDLKPELLKQLDCLQPTGYGNPEAVFISRNVNIQSSRTVGADSKHLKLMISDGHITFDAIGFRMGDRLLEMPNRVDLLYTFERNDYNGRQLMQLNLKDLKPAGMTD